MSRSCVAQSARLLCADDVRRVPARSDRRTPSRTAGSRRSIRNEQAAGAVALALGHAVEMASASLDVLLARPACWPRLRDATAMRRSRRRTSDRAATAFAQDPARLLELAVGQRLAARPRSRGRRRATSPTAFAIANSCRRLRRLVAERLAHGAPPACVAAPSTCSLLDARSRRRWRSPLPVTACVALTDTP